MNVGARERLVVIGGDAAGMGQVQLAGAVGVVAVDVVGDGASASGAA
jgi:hypothetical protein